MADQKTTARNRVQPSSPAPWLASNLWQKGFLAFMGVWLGLVFFKLGNPVIFGDQIEPPGNIVELAVNSWPISWGYGLLGSALVLSLSAWRWRPAAPKWVLILPLIWFGWQLLSARQTVNENLTRQTLLDFAACTTCFYLGLFALSRFRNYSVLWLGLLLGLVLSLWSGLGQHFGGLEEARRYVETIRWDLYPPELKARLTSPEFQQKISSNRIFGSFVYPNALAGGILLALPPGLFALWGMTERLPFILRGVLTGTLAWMGVACLYWSGSKAGWLIFLVMGIIAFLHLGGVPRKTKLLAIAVILAVGIAGFYGKHSGYFAKKTNSATARMDYWRAAWQLLKEKPVFGSGPGTFKVGYQRLKRPDSEPTRLAHNDYLQQGSDSGVIGLCSFAALIAGSIVSLYRRAPWKKTSASGADPSSDQGGPLSDTRQHQNWMTFAVWLGVAGLAAQECVEFSLYIPALSWPLFLFLGWLWGAAAADGCLGQMPSTTQGQPVRVGIR